MRDSFNPSLLGGNQQEFRSGFGGPKTISGVSGFQPNVKRENINRNRDTTDFSELLGNNYRPINRVIPNQQQTASFAEIANILNDIKGLIQKLVDNTIASNRTNDIETILTDHLTRTEFVFDLNNKTLDFIRKDNLSYLDFQKKSLEIFYINYLERFTKTFDFAKFRLEANLEKVASKYNIPVSLLNMYTQTSAQIMSKNAKYGPEALNVIFLSNIYELFRHFVVDFNAFATRTDKTDLTDDLFNATKRSFSKTATDSLLKGIQKIPLVGGITAGALTSIPGLIDGLSKFFRREEAKNKLASKYASKKTPEMRTADAVSLLPQLTETQNAILSGILDVQQNMYEQNNQLLTALTGSSHTYTQRQTTDQRTYVAELGEFLTATELADYKTNRNKAVREDLDKGFRGFLGKKFSFSKRARNRQAAEIIAEIENKNAFNREGRGAEYNAIGSHFVKYSPKGTDTVATTLPMGSAVIPKQAVNAYPEAKKLGQTVPFTTVSKPTIGVVPNTHVGAMVTPGEVIVPPQIAQSNPKLINSLITDGRKRQGINVYSGGTLYSDYYVIGGIANKVKAVKESAVDKISQHETVSKVKSKIDEYDQVSLKDLIGEPTGSKIEETYLSRFVPKYLRDIAVELYNSDKYISSFIQGKKNKAKEEIVDELINEFFQKLVSVTPVLGPIISLTTKLSKDYKKVKSPEASLKENLTNFVKSTTGTKVAEYAGGVTGGLTGIPLGSVLGKQVYNIGKDSAVKIHKLGREAGYWEQGGYAIPPHYLKQGLKSIPGKYTVPATGSLNLQTPITQNINVSSSSNDNYFELKDTIVSAINDSSIKTIQEDFSKFKEKYLTTLDLRYKVSTYQQVKRALDNSQLGLKAKNDNVLTLHERLAANRDKLQTPATSNMPVIPVSVQKEKNLPQEKKEKGWLSKVIDFITSAAVHIGMISLLSPILIPLFKGIMNALFGEKFIQGVSDWTPTFIKEMFDDEGPLDMMFNAFKLGIGAVIVGPIAFSLVKKGAISLITNLGGYIFKDLLWDTLIKPSINEAGREAFSSIKNILKTGLGRIVTGSFMFIFDGVVGAIDGYKEGGILGMIGGFVKGALTSSGITGNALKYGIAGASIGAVAGGIGAIPGALIGALIGGIVQFLFDNFSEMMDIFSGAMDTVKEWISPITNFFTVDIPNIFADLNKLLEDAKNNIMSGLYSIPLVGDLFKSDDVKNQELETLKKEYEQKIKDIEIERNTVATERLKVGPDNPIYIPDSDELDAVQEREKALAEREEELKALQEKISEISNSLPKTNQLTTSPITTESIDIAGVRKGGGRGKTGETYVAAEGGVPEVFIPDDGSSFDFLTSPQLYKVVKDGVFVPLDEYLQSDNGIKFVFNSETWEKLKGKASELTTNGIEALKATPDQIQQLASTVTQQGSQMLGTAGDMVRQTSEQFGQTVKSGIKTTKSVFNPNETIEKEILDKLQNSVHIIRLYKSDDGNIFVRFQDDTDYVVYSNGMPRAYSELDKIIKNDKEQKYDEFKDIKEDDPEKDKKREAIKKEQDENIKKELEEQNPIGSALANFSESMTSGLTNAMKFFGQGIDPETEKAMKDMSNKILQNPFGSAGDAARGASNLVAENASPLISKLQNAATEGLYSFMYGSQYKKDFTFGGEENKKKFFEQLQGTNPGDLKANLENYSKQSDNYQNWYYHYKDKEKFDSKKTYTSPYVDNDAYDELNANVVSYGQLQQSTPTTATKTPVAPTIQSQPTIATETPTLPTQNDLNSNTYIPSGPSYYRPLPTNFASSTSSDDSAEKLKSIITELPCIPICKEDINNIISRPSLTTGSTDLITSSTTDKLILSQTENEQNKKGIRNTELELIRRLDANEVPTKLFAPKESQYFIKFADGSQYLVDATLMSEAYNKIKSKINDPKNSTYSDAQKSSTQSPANAPTGSPGNNTNEQGQEGQEGQSGNPIEDAKNDFLNKLQQLAGQQQGMQQGGQQPTTGGSNPPSGQQGGQSTGVNPSAMQQGNNFINGLQQLAGQQQGISGGSMPGMPSGNPGGSMPGMPSGSSGGQVQGSDNASKAMNYFMSKGWTKEQAAGIVGNLQQESGQGLNPHAVNATGHYGLAQWDPKDRAPGFQRKYGKPIQQSTFEEQLEYINWELTQGPEKKAGNALKQSKTAEDAARIFEDKYERSGGSAVDKRMSNASNLMNLPSSTNAPGGNMPGMPSGNPGGNMPGMPSGNPGGSMPGMPSGSPGGSMPGMTPQNIGDVGKIVQTGKGYNVVELADGSVVKRTGNRNWRNNNPGNIEYGEFAKKMGAIGSDGRFAIFPSMQAGRKAKESLIFEGKNYKDKTLTQAIERYAPPSENNTQRYQQAVLSAVGNVNKPMSQYTPEERAKIMDAMQKVEGDVKNGKTEVLKQGTGQLPTAQQVTPGSMPGSNVAGAPGSMPGQIQTVPAVDSSQAYSNQLGGKRVSSEFGMRTHPKTGERKMHKGIDIAGPKGTPIKMPGSMKPGVVTFSGVQRGYGNIVEVKHDDGTTTRYAHMSENSVKVGQKVDSNTQLGKMGSTGVSTGSHLHFEVRDEKGNPVDPNQHLAKVAREQGIPPQTAQQQIAQQSKPTTGITNPPATNSPTVDPSKQSDPSTWQMPGQQVAANAPITGTNDVQIDFDKMQADMNNGNLPMFASTTNGVSDVTNLNDPNAMTRGFDSSTPKGGSTPKGILPDIQKQSREETLANIRKQNGVESSTTNRPTTATERQEGRLLPDIQKQSREETLANIRKQNGVESSTTNRPTTATERQEGRLLPDIQKQSREETLANIRKQNGVESSTTNRPTTATERQEGRLLPDIQKQSREETLANIRKQNGVESTTGGKMPTDYERRQEEANKIAKKYGVESSLASNKTDAQRRQEFMNGTDGSRIKGIQTSNVKQEYPTANDAINAGFAEGAKETKPTTGTTTPPSKEVTVPQSRLDLQTKFGNASTTDKKQTYATANDAINAGFAEGAKETKPTTGTTTPQVLSTQEARNKIVSKLQDPNLSEEERAKWASSIPALNEADRRMEEAKQPKLETGVTSPPSKEDVDLESQLQTTVNEAQTENQLQDAVNIPSPTGTSSGPPSSVSSESTGSGTTQQPSYNEQPTSQQMQQPQQPSNPLESAAQGFLSTLQGLMGMSGMSNMPGNMFGGQMMGGFNRPNMMSPFQSLAGGGANLMGQGFNAISQGVNNLISGGSEIALTPPQAQFDVQNATTSTIQTAAETDMMRSDMVGQAISGSLAQDSYGLVDPGSLSTHSELKPPHHPINLSGGASGFSKDEMNTTPVDPLGDDIALRLFNLLSPSLFYSAKNQAMETKQNNYIENIFI